MKIYRAQLREGDLIFFSLVSFCVFHNSYSLILLLQRIGITIAKLPFCFSECLEKEKYLASLGQHDQLPSEDLSPETITNSKIELTRSDLMLDILPLEDIPPQIKTKSKIEPVVSDSTLDMEDISPQIKTNSKLE